jgi:hypothetical protein
VVFSDGADRAARVSREDMQTAIADPAYEHYDLFAIGIGEKAELEQAQLTDIGRDGTEQGDDRSKVKDAFDRIAGKIESHTKRFYLLSYCTPAREGEHVVRIEIEDEKIGSGSLEYSFQAAGFGPPPDCDPARAPSFSLKDVQAHPESP